MIKLLFTDPSDISLKLHVVTDREHIVEILRSLVMRGFQLKEIHEVDD